MTAPTDEKADLVLEHAEILASRMTLEEVNQAKAAMSDGGHPYTLEERYLDLMKRCLTRLVFAEEDYVEVLLDRQGWQRPPARLAARVLKRFGLRLTSVGGPNIDRRTAGRDWPQHGETMIGMQRLDNLQHCVQDVLDNQVPGDLIEAGVWRGGASIFMRAILAARDETSRRVWLADSFRGLPVPNAAKYPADAGIDLSKEPRLAVDVDTVKENFRRYGLLDDQVRFLVGWFSETLPDAPISELAVIRLDDDLYESTMDALSALYPKLSLGGYVIIDDYGAVPACRQATHDYRDVHGITDEIHDIDGYGAFWKRER